jgi:hypothetical protein
VNEPASWTNLGHPWYCVIKADRKKFKGVSKVWIPKSYAEDGKPEPTPLWSFRTNNDATIKKYIESKGVQNPEKALRFAEIPSMPGKLQMVIPTEMINGNDLDLWAQCWKTEAELKENSSEIVDWTKWTIAGDRDTADPEPSGSSNTKVRRYSG